jgi:curved DNA-binding protein CbpA
VTVPVLKQRFKRLALRYHPDRAGGDTQKMAAISSAYETLLEHLKAA